MVDFFEEQPTETEAEQSTEALASPIVAKNKKNQTEGEGTLTVDVYQTDNDIVIKSTMAGVKSGDLDITINNDMVTIKGDREPDDKIKQSDYHWQELYWGPFSRTVILPEEIDIDGSKASIKNGVLTIKMPRLSKNKSKKVKVS